MLPKLAPRIKVNFSLRFCHQVLKLDHLTYGLWDGENLDLAGLRQAQARYSQKLLGWIPPQTRSVLDVGCGVGENAKILKARGLEVEGLSPDPFQQQIFHQRTGGLPFHLTRFENFDCPRRYDLVLMSESAQYLFLGHLFEAAAAAAPGGHLLIADYFTNSTSGIHGAGSGHPWQAFLDRAEGRGFRLLKQEDITQQVLPTLHLATRLLEDHGLPAFSLFRDTIESRYPLVYRLLYRLLEKRLTRLETSFRQIDPEAFARDKRYSLLLFAVPENLPFGRRKNTDSPPHRSRPNGATL